MRLIMHAAWVSMLATSSKCVSTSWFGSKNQELLTEMGIKAAVLNFLSWYYKGHCPLQRTFLRPPSKTVRQSMKEKAEIAMALDSLLPRQGGHNTPKSPSPFFWPQEIPIVSYSSVGILCLSVFLRSVSAANSVILVPPAGLFCYLLNHPQSLSRRRGGLLPSFVFKGSPLYRLFETYFCFIWCI